MVVTTYTLFRLESDAYRTVAWAGLILDEAQYVKNHQAKTYRCVRELAAPFKLAITGTPMENNLMELWSLLSITAPGLFPDPKRFAEQYARPIERGGDAERLARLRRRIKPLLKRRTKELVAADLPAKQEQTLDVDLHPRHRKLYDTHLQRERQKVLGLIDDFDRNRFTILRSITLLRQLSLHAGLVDDDHDAVPCAKLGALVEQLEDIVGGGHRALVFSQFTGFLAKARERLDAEGIGYCYLDGRTRRRDRVLERFKDGEDPVFLISLKAGGFGLNLTEADYCFLLDPWWNPATEAQAIDRTHRIGQTRPVMVYRTIARDTIEEKVVALARRKAALFSGVMDEGDLFACKPHRGGHPRAARLSGAEPQTVLQHPLVHAVPSLDLSAHSFHRAVHRRVGLQDPAHLPALLRCVFGSVEVHLIEARRDACVAVVGLDAEHDHADRVDLLTLAQRRQPAEWEQAAVELGEHLVVIGQRQRGADDLAGVLVFGDHRPVLIQDRLEVLGVVANLLLGQRHKSPVALPRGVVDLHKAVHLGLQILLAEVTTDDPVLRLDLSGHLPDRRMDLLAPLHVQAPHVQVHRLRRFRSCSNRR